MAEERRRFNFFRRRENKEVKPVRNDIPWDAKSLASLSKIATVSAKKAAASGANTQISYHLLRDISLKSEVVNAILRRTVDDVLANGYEFRLMSGIEEGNEEQLQRLHEFFRTPNPDDMGDEWLESLVYDLALFGDSYLELDGDDDESSANGEDWIYGGNLVSVWPVPAETMRLLPGNQRPEPPEMAYIQEIRKEKRRFASNKILHISKFKQGRGYGTSPLIPLLNTIAGQMNLSNYLNEMFTGTLPKTILNVGDISNSEMKAMLGLLEQQLTAGKSPFGLVAINGGSGFNMHRLIDSTKEGQQLDLLYYYREEICAVFGIPPMKLGWVQTGKMSNPEQQLDAWYDVVESYHHRVSSAINNKLLPLLEVTDWKIHFNTIRPSRESERADTFRLRSQAISNLRQESAISINEAREVLGLAPLLDKEEANDPFFLSPKLAINKGKVEDGEGEEPESVEEAAENLVEEGIVFGMDELLEYRLLGLENEE
jgi:phage portal protein BeeE